FQKLRMVEDSDLEIILEDEVSEDQDIVAPQTSKRVKITIHNMNGGMKDAYWTKCRRLFLPTMGIDGALSIEETINASIALLFEVDELIYAGSLFLRLKDAVVSGSSVLTKEHLANSTKRTAYYALTTMHGYGLFPKGFVYLCINLLGSDGVKMRKALEPLRKLKEAMKGQLTFISKCSEKRVGKNKELEDACVKMQEMVDRHILPQYPRIFEIEKEKWPSYVTEWMKKSPITKSGVEEWSAKMGVETDLNGFPLRINEEFVMPEMADEFLVEEEKKMRERKEKKRGGKEEKVVPMKKEKRRIPPPPPKTKPVSLMDQVISNPFGYPRMVPPPPIPHPAAFPHYPPFGPPDILGPPFIMGPIEGTGTRDPFANALPPMLMEIEGAMMDTPLTSKPRDVAESNEERRKLEKMAKLMIGGVERKREDDTEGGIKKMRIDEEEMNERERRLHRWLEEKNGRRRRNKGDERRGRSKSRSRERERERNRDERGDFERRVEELERKRKEEMEERERCLKEACVEHWRKVKGSFKPMDESKWEFRPDWGVTTVWRRVSGHSRWEEKVKDKLDSLSMKIKDHFINNVQTPEDEHRKKLVLERLQDGMQMKLDSTGVLFLMAGSTPCSFASKTSNLDLVLISPVPTMSPEHIRDLFFNDLPYIIMQRGGTITRQEALWMEFECTMSGNRLGVRIAIDSGAYYFSKIMAVYDCIDGRVSALLHYIKHWTATHLRRADDISKYLLTNLVIHYLQSGVSPPVLPCLHLLYPARLAPDIFSSFDYASPFEPPLPEGTNRQSLASLFIGFLMYYASFDFSRYAISVRAGTVIRKRDVGGRVPELAVEHPLDGTYSAVVNDPFTASHFTAAMTAACQDAITTLHI
ncbi:hypothetical protein PMAYCL1PPCAC_29286, partial [Pristionchus mayeri]